ncbi:MAG: fumarylacetoacetate hydrolase family protein [Deltaproteobacteria bacterium]|jgi:2-keto-4-pentenoate hydratase/2-oxohepta-3-ene-1,7-dioic acid hydratase in catechol pathway|nr:fumarylacetoacetate hydrolase family protein [Deltaproteobacteria bacterium]
MKILRFEKFGTAKYGILDSTMNQIRELSGKPYGSINIAELVHKIEDVKILPPSEGGKVIGVALNYRDHAKELGRKIPDEPLIFFKPTSALIGHGDTIVLPQSCGRVDYEGELAVIIGRKGKSIPEDEARKHILGYSCFNDITARDLQTKDTLFARAKGFDTFAPVGPYVETDIEPDDLRIKVFVNGNLKQDGSTRKMIFDVYTLIHFISSIMTLYPGDIIATGTPPGVGPLKPEDIVEVEIEGIGRLANKVVHFLEKVES